MILSLLVVSFAFTAHASLEKCDEIGQMKPDSENCQLFYICSAIGWAPIHCDDGFYFNQNLLDCGRSKDGSKCGDDDDDDSNLKPCDTVGQLKADETDCRKFYQCTNNGWFPLYCQEGLVFNEEISVCDYPKAGTKCENATNTDDSSGNQGQDDDPKYDACDDVGKLKGDKEDCQKFYQCTNSGWAPLTCKDGLIFNEEISVCDWAKEGTKCGKDSNKDDNSGNENQGQDDGIKYDACDEVGKLKGDKEDCQKFYQCTHNGWAPLTCKDGLIFNEEISVCDWPKEGTKCGKDSNKDDNSGNGNQGQDDGIKYDACDEVGKLKGDKQDCQKFYQCTHNGWAPLTCKDGLFFNEEISVCDWPQDGAKCGKDSNADNSGNGNQQQDVEPKYDACDEVGKLEGDKEDCQKFYQCTHKGWAPLSCKNGLFFNKEISVCDWPKEGTKCGKDSNTDDSSGNENQGRDDGTKYHACDEVGKLKGDKEDCRKFYQCTHNGWAPLTCKDGLFFNEEISVCDWPKEGNKCGKDSNTADNSGNGNQGQDDGTKYDACDEVGKLKGDKEDCQKFYQCTHNGWVPLTCQEGLIFNEEISVCDWPKEGTKCKKDTNTDDDSNDDQDQSGLEPCNVLGQMKEDSDHCDLYYHCTSCGWSLKPCDSGLLFNSETLICERADKVTCSKKADQSLESCEKVSELKADPENCSRYYECTNYGWQNMPCYKNLVFNSEKLICDYAYNVKC